MIPRILVPVDVRPVSRDEVRKPARRLETYMDERTVVPSGISDAPPLDGKSSIPSHLPLGVLVDRTLVPRGMEAKPFVNLQPITDYVPIAILDSRVVVPAFVEPPEQREIDKFDQPPEMTEGLREIVEPDFYLTGEANLLVESEKKRDPRWDFLTRVSSVGVHILLIIFIISLPKIFPPHIPTREEVELASRQLGVTYISPDEIPKSPKAPPGPAERITPKVLNKVAPPRAEEHAPVEAPRTPAPDLPSAPTPQPSTNSAPTQPTPNPTPSRLLPTPSTQPPTGKLNLQLPSSSPGKALQDQLQDAIRHSGSGTYTSSGSGPRGAGGGGGGGGPSFGNGVTILTPTEGVDFQSYINRLVATVKRNWYAVMPESAMMGDRGVVGITFRINRDGSVPMGDPNLERSSGKDPLDTAAMSSIRTSSPFEPLPPQFKGPFIELRFGFYYNIPIDGGQ